MDGLNAYCSSDGSACSDKEDITADDAKDGEDEPIKRKLADDEHPPGSAREDSTAVRVKQAKPNHGTVKELPTLINRSEIFKRDDQNDSPEPPESSVDDTSRVVEILSEAEARHRKVFLRNEPHIRGNWAGLVYMKIETDDADDEDESDPEETLSSEEWRKRQRNACEKLKQQQQQQQQRNFNNNKQQPIKDFVLHDQIHISLTRTFYLQAASISSFLKSLRRIIDGWKSITRVVLATNRVIALVNDAETRSFWAWPVVQGESHLKTLINALDGLLDQYQQPPYYQPPMFHATFASSPLRGGRENFTKNGSETQDGEASLLEYTVTKIYCRIGDHVHTFPFR